jgi:hypothetical protein
MERNEIRRVGRQGVHARLRRAMGARRTIDDVATRSIACAVPTRQRRGTETRGHGAQGRAFAHPTATIGNSDRYIDKPLFDSRPPQRSYRLRRTGRAGRDGPKSDANRGLSVLASEVTT